MGITKVIFFCQRKKTWQPVNIFVFPEMDLMQIKLPTTVPDADLQTVIR